METVTDVLESGQPIKVHLLLSFPTDTMPNTWNEANWEGYAPAYAFATIETRIHGCIGGYLECYFNILPEDSQKVKAVGVTYHDKFVFVGDFQPSSVGGYVKFLVRFLVQAWLI